MKIGVLSDTHIPVAHMALPPEVFSIFQGVDLILHAGDIVELGLLDELRVLAPVEAVAGNMDDLEVHSRLPRKKVLKLGSFKAGLTHGKYRIDVQRDRVREEFESDQVDLIIYGHSHAPFWGKENGIYFLNPGSPTDKRYAPFNSVAILEVGKELNAEIIRI